MKPILLFLILYSLLHNARALEIDEKLTIRILRLSSTKKTALVNRGLEDALAVGDHAKFFLTTGVVARGVVVQISPGRSIWSLYRLVTPEAVIVDKMMNIKISAPIKLTDDPSKSLYATSTSSHTPVAIPLAEGANDLIGQDLEESERSDLLALGGIVSEGILESPQIQTVNLELFSLAHYNFASTASDLGNNESVKETGSGTSFSLGGEIYLPHSSPLLRKFSLFGLYYMGEQNATYSSRAKSSTEIKEYGGGIAYHFWGNPRAYGRLIGFVSASGGVGTTEDSLSFTDGSASQANTGDSTFFGGAIGVKYFGQEGFGGRIVASYVSRSEDYAFDRESQNYDRTTTAPGIQLGFSYRF